MLHTHTNMTYKKKIHTCMRHVSVRPFLRSGQPVLVDLQNLIEVAISRVVRACHQADTQMHQWCNVCTESIICTRRAQSSSSTFTGATSVWIYCLQKKRHGILSSSSIFSRRAWSLSSTFTGATSMWIYHLQKKRRVILVSSSMFSLSPTYCGVMFVWN